MKNSCDENGWLNPQEEEMIPLGRKSFPDGFFFGVGSSAYQEVPMKEGEDPTFGILSIMTTLEDVELLKKLGVGAYRFSISWPRILPTGSLKGVVNSEGINYYNNLINELLANGIHWDVPQGLEDEYGGFLSSRIVDDFKDFAEICFRELGDRVKH